MFGSGRYIHIFRVVALASGRLDQEYKKNINSELAFKKAQSGFLIGWATK